MGKEEKSKLFGLLGRDISYSFSRGYFTKKFSALNLEHHSYVNFDIPKIEDFPSIIENNESIKGINVTIPYKEEVMAYLDKIDKTAKEIGAVNTIKITKRGNLKGYNSDVVGFEKSIVPLLEKHHKKALILGTGGASKAIAYALKLNNIKYKFVSRNPKTKKQISYNDLSQEIMQDYTIIVNSTPLGTSPDVDKCPAIPYQFITSKHLLYDLIYNPEVSKFLANGKANGAKIKNGYEMLELQAEESWRIWNS
ncbi:shikimate dehydrogenase [Polaribacter sp. MED152]|uniref:shikimate dehydrogenase family protein n=1 Tax=Polaribacter sp. MED152 TaxID=313598 RepID=UPI000068C537|nr:shikimate dehydrogenase [Polaribacter sp. MED152]EAQ41973.1 shikimate 5-dehydrogenase [Polaribacter sp. MED152]